MSQSRLPTFLNISAGYKFRQGNIKPSTSLKIKTHKRNSKSSLKIYRAFDKQRLLQQIDNKLCKQEQVRTQNKFLKAQLNKEQNKASYKICHVGQTRMMLESLQKQNQELNAILELRTKQLESVKRSTPYTQFLQVLLQYENNKQELDRLKLVIKEKKSKRLLQKKMRKKLLSQLTNNIEKNKRGTIEKRDRIDQLRQLYENMKQQVIFLKDKNNGLERNKKRLKQDIENIKNKMNISTPTPVRTPSTCRTNMAITKMYEYNRCTFNEAIKIKNKKMVDKKQKQGKAESRQKQSYKNNYSEQNISSVNSSNYSNECSLDQSI